MQAEEILVNLGMIYSYIGAFIFVACIIMDRMETFKNRNKPKRVGDFPFVINVCLYIFLSAIWLPYIIADVYKTYKTFITTK